MKKTKTLFGIIVALGITFTLGAATGTKITAELKNVGIVKDNTTTNMKE